MVTKQELPEDFEKFKHGFPLRENCDPKNPYQAFLWMLVALPYQTGGPMAFPTDYMQFVSKHEWDLGAHSWDYLVSIADENGMIHVSQLHEPTKKYQPPLATDANWMTSPGRWVPIDTPDNDPRRPVEQAVDTLTHQQQAELVNELWSRLTPEQQRLLAERSRDDDNGC